MRNYRLWTTAEIQKIRILARHHDAAAIAKKLGRTPRSVESVALRNGISFTAMRAWTKAEDDMLRENAGKMLIRNLAKRLKRTPNVVKRRGRELGISFQKRGYYHHHATHPLRLRKKYAKLRAGGMAQAAAARVVGVHQATAQRWESSNEQSAA